MPFLGDFPTGQTLFLDANIFLEHLLTGEPTCTTLLQRIRVGEVQGITSVVVLAEVRHRLVLTEAVRRGVVPDGRRALARLRSHPHLLAQLQSIDDGLNTLLELPLRIVSVTPRQFRMAQRLASRYHLLTNDALHLAALWAHGLRHLASADRDFLRIPRLTLWAP